MIVWVVTILSRSRNSDFKDATDSLTTAKESEASSKKEIKDLKAQVKKLRRVKEGQGGALEDLLAAEQDLELVRRHP